MSDTKVFGIGLEKTGTNTLSKALEILGYADRKGFDLDLLTAYKNEQHNQVVAAAADCNHAIDYPWAFCYKELYKAYPDAKFILTVRTSAMRWFNSLCHHARRTGPDQVRQMVYGHAMPNLFEAEDIAFYENHVAEIRSFFASKDDNRFLEVCWAKEDGWNELCTFLDVAIPETDFPHLKR